MMTNVLLTFIAMTTLYIVLGFGQMANRIENMEDFTYIAEDSLKTQVIDLREIHEKIERIERACSKKGS